jgi:hypothetical protein
MPRTLYSPRLSDDVVRALYREGRRRNQPMTRLADALLRQALGSAAIEEEPESSPDDGRILRFPDASAA